jgi:Domain of unknown function (DUF4389)
VTAYPPYQAYPGPAPAIAAPPAILVAVSEPVPQRRVTVAFRLILAVPHLFVLYFSLIAVLVVAFIGWWGALFTGRLPQFAVTFQSGVLRWMTRVFAYTFLLTDVYPPFTTGEVPDYPVQVAIPEPQRLNRAAVLFRCFLVFPVGILGNILFYGAGGLMAFIAWLIALVAGQLPPSLYLAYAGVLRFQVRLTGYWLMLTPAYPGGLYGDGPGAVAWADQLPLAQSPGYGTPGAGYGNPGSGNPGYGTPGYGDPSYGNPGYRNPGYGNPADSAPQGYGSAQGYGSPEGYGVPQAYGSPQGYGPPQGYGTPQGYDPAQGYGSPQGYGTPAGYGAPVPGYGAPAGYGTPGGYGVRPVFQPVTWLLPLTSGARKLVTTFIVLGSLLYGGTVASDVETFASRAGTLNDTQTATTAIGQLNTSYATLSDSLHAFDQATTNCNQNLTCVTKEDTKAASAFSLFSDQLADTSVPTGTAADEARLAAAATASQQAFVRLSKTTTASQYQSAIASTGLQQTLNGFDSDFNALTAKLQTY